MKKGLAWVIISIIVIALLSLSIGCKAESETVEEVTSTLEEETAEKPAEEAEQVEEGVVYNIAIMPFHLPCMWFSPYTAGGYWYLKQRGHVVRTANAEWDTKKMNTILMTWAEDPNLDGVIIAPLGGEEVLPGIKALKEAGKIVVLSNNDAGYCPEAEFCVRFDSPNACAGGAEKMVQMLIEKNGEAKGTIILGLGDVRNSEHLERAAGARDVFKKYPDIELREFVSDMDAGKAATQTGTLLRTLPQVDGIFSVGMLEFMGMINALEREGMAFPKGDPNHIIFAGMDTCADVINPAVREGIVDFVIDQPVLAYNALSAYYLLRLLEDGAGALPAPGDIINPEDVDISSVAPEIEVTVPSDSWAPAEVLDTTEEFGHIWIKTNYVIVDDTNVDDPTLWSNISAKIKDFGF